MMICQSSYVDIHDIEHRCDRAAGHIGAHSCGVEEHFAPACADDCCHEHWPDGESWPNTPGLMLRASWTIADARPGDLILLDASHPAHRAHTVLWIGEQVVVLLNPKGREVAYRHPDWNWRLLSRPRVS